MNSVGDDTTPGDGLVTLREAILAAENDTTTDLGQTGDEFDFIQIDPSLTSLGPVTITVSTIGDTTFGPAAFKVTKSIGSRRARARQRRHDRA